MGKALMGRIHHDAYYTPQWMSLSLMQHAKIEGSIFEPCCGKDFAIVNAFSLHSQQTHHIITNDLHIDNADFKFDATDRQQWENTSALARGDVDWVITNPPFKCAQAILENAYEFARVGVAFLLRVTADEMVVSKKLAARAHWWAEHPEQLSIKLPRYSFAKSSATGKASTDSAYCQWFVWRKDGLIYPQPVIRVPHDQIDGFHRKPIEV